MRFTNVICVLAFGGLAAATMGTGCGGGSDTSSSSSGSTSTGTGGGDTASTSVSTGTSSAFPCSPDSKCTEVASECIALTDNKGKDTFTLRMSQLSIAKPAALAKPGLAKNAIESGVVMSLAPCNLKGTGTFNLLLQFDTKNKKIKVGGAKPTTTPAKGYTYATGMASGLDIGPITDDLDLDASGNFSPAKGADINLPIYFAATDATPGVVLPLHKASITGTLTDNNNCVGKYNADKLDPKKLCGPTDTVPYYTDGADLDAYITLEEADKVVIAQLGQSLCVLLSDNATMYGDMSTPKKCTRDAAGKILFKGDWCSTTNSPGSAACNDASKLTGTLAASAVAYVP